MYFVYNGELYHSSELYHFNPFHDPKDGRFTSSGGGSRFSGAKTNGKTSKGEPKPDWDHSKSKKAYNIAKFAANVAYDVATLNPIGLALDVKDAVDVSSSMVKEASYKKRKSKLDVDEKTGLPLKNKEWTDKQDVKAVNPAFKNFDENTKSNCVLCSMAMELRQRGYDVAANKASKGYTNEEVKRWFPKADFKVVQFSSEQIKGIDYNKSPVYSEVVASRANKKLRRELAESFINDVSKEPEGSRGFVSVRWAGLKGGHSLYYKVEQGKMKIYDGQTGKIYNDPHKILDHGYKFYHARVDNTKFDPKTIKEVTL